MTDPVSNGIVPANVTIKKGEGITQALKRLVDSNKMKLSDGKISKEEWQATLKVLDEIQSSRKSSKESSIFGKNYLVHTNAEIKFTAEETERLYKAMGVEFETKQSSEAASSTKTQPEAEQPVSQQAKTSDNPAETQSQPTEQAVSQLPQEAEAPKTPQENQTSETSTPQPPQTAAENDLGEYAKGIVLDNVDVVAKVVTPEMKARREELQEKLGGNYEITYAADGSFLVRDKNGEVNKEKTELANHPENHNNRRADSSHIYNA